MARALITEEESGTCRGWTHPHNGYYAGDFSDPTNASMTSAHHASGQLPLRLLPGTGPALADVTAPSERAA
jgi:hypothetical protein